MKLIVGLGNVGSKYAKTRHNLGFMVVDQLVASEDWPALKLEKKFKAELRLGDIGKTAVILAKPTTMMNLSGYSVQAIASFYRIKPKDVWVIYDDIDLEFGKLRIRSGGGSGGHNGVASVIEAIGDGFVRYRVGIGSNRALGQPSEQYVLDNFSAEQAEDIPKILKDTVDSILYHIDDSETFDHTRNLLE